MVGLPRGIKFLLAVLNFEHNFEAVKVVPRMMEGINPLNMDAGSYQSSI